MFLTDENISLESDKFNKLSETKIKFDSSILDENFQKIKLEYENKYLIINIDTYGNYYLSDSENDTLFREFNIKLIYTKKKKLPFIFENLLTILNKSNETVLCEKNPYNTIFPVKEKSKEIINLFDLEKNSNSYRESLSKKNLSRIPKNLLYNTSQIFKMISNEIISINTNLDYPHSILPESNNIYNLIVKIKFKSSKLSDAFEEINNKFGYNYIQLKLSIDPHLYPFSPPKIEYMKPKVSHLLLFSLNNLSVLKLKNWNPTISIESIILNIHDNLVKDDILLNNLYLDSEYNSKDFSFDNLDRNLVKLANLSGEENINKIEFVFDKSKINYTKKQKQKYFAQGTGYGYDGTSTWDIESYLKEQEESSQNISLVLKEISEEFDKELNENISDIINNSVLISFMINKFRGTTLLEIEKNQGIFNSIMDIFKSKYFSNKDNFSQEMINKIGKALKPINDDISNMLNMELDKKLDVFLRIHSLSEMWIENISGELKSDNTEDDIKTEFKNKMEQIQVVKFDREINDFYYSEKIKSIDYSGNTCLRIVNEWSTFKNLPIYWDSTVFIRYYTQTIAGLKFMITGPKNTPYENGLYEFHAYYPKEYPETEPKVNFMTTGGNKVRFNPNLYDSGKVCLSLLGTWGGGKDEKWNKTSNMFTVICSIQGQILGVDFPYYNEPGWEKQMYTEAGKKKAFKYNDLRRYKNLQVAINDQIEKPPEDFKDVVESYFVYKEKEILERCNQWAEESLEYKKEIKSEIERFQVLMKKLKDSK